MDQSLVWGEMLGLVWISRQYGGSSQFLVTRLLERGACISGHKNNAELSLAFLLPCTLLHSSINNNDTERSLAEREREKQPSMPAQKRSSPDSLHDHHRRAKQSKDQQERPQQNRDHDYNSDGSATLLQFLFYRFFVSFSRSFSPLFSGSDHNHPSFSAYEEKPEYSLSLSLGCYIVYALLLKVLYFLFIYLSRFAF